MRRETGLAPRVEFNMRADLPFKHRGNAGDDFGKTAVPSLKGLSHLANLTLNLVGAWR
jgi:hypothetical protein